MKKLVKESLNEKQTQKPTVGDLITKLKSFDSNLPIALWRLY